ncbi:glycosyltransferase family 1 protein, partial [Streptomyces decoyicus]
RRALRRDLPALGDLPPDGPLVVCVGRLCPQKPRRGSEGPWPSTTGMAVRLPVRIRVPERGALA